MKKVKLINKAHGISQKGNAWYRVTLGSDFTRDGEKQRTTEDFFVSEEIFSKIARFDFDTEFYVSVELDDRLRLSVSDIRPVQTDTVVKSTAEKQ